MKKYIVVILLCLVLTGCKSKIIEDNTNDNLKVIMSNIEVYSDVYLYDVIDNISDVSITTKNSLIDTSSLGEKEIVINYIKDKKNYVYKNKINVVDTTPPLVFSGTTKSVKLGYDDDICNVISYGDMYDGDIKCTIEGDYDVNKVGTYKLVYALSDSSNNEKKVNVTLKVYEPKESNEDNNDDNENRIRTDFLEVYQKHKTEDNEIGIDVSKWQEDIDFNKVKAAGASFVIMRIGYQGQTSREIYIDEYYKENIRKAKEAGLKVGVYFFTVAGSREEAISHAKWVVDTLGGESLDLPIAFDWENWARWNSYKVSFHEINEIANAYMDELEKNGYKSMLYSSKFYLETIWQNKKNYPVWLAHYTKENNRSSYTGNYIMWQLCDNGKIDGINNDVDIDILYH